MLPRSAEVWEGEDARGYQRLLHAVSHYARCAGQIPSASIQSAVSNVRVGRGRPEEGTLARLAT